MAYGKQNNCGGFTLVEVGIVVPMLIVMLLGLTSTLYMALRANVTQQVQTTSAYDIQEGLSIVERDVALASQFLDTTDSTAIEAYPPTANGGKWSYVGDGATQRALILRLYATTTNPDSNDRQPVFINQVGCSTDRIYYNDAADYNTIYFLLNNNLYRRRVLKTTASTCSVPYQQQSCPSLETLKSGSRDSSCQSDDELIISGVSSFTVDYYGVGSDLLDAYDETTGVTTMQNAASIDVIITTTRKAMGKDTKITSSLRMQKLNVTRTVN